MTYTTERLGDVFGVPAQTLIGRMIGDQALGEVDPKDGMRLLEAMKAHDPFRNMELSVRRPDGASRVFNISGTPVFTEMGAFKGFRGTGTDITQQRAAEEQLLQAQKMETVGQLTGGVAHDFNNLLAVIMGNLELVEETLGNNRRARETVLHAFSAAERGATLIQRLLAFSRRQSLAPKIVDINTLITGVSVVLKRTLEGSITIREDLDPDVWLVKVDPAQLETALLNLALNARDAMPTGGALTIETRNVALQGATASGDNPVEPGDYVAISVRDTGTGMTPDVQKRIFEPFFTTKDVGTGSGLGLSMVYGFVRQSGGRIEADTTPGKGTIMTLYLPRLIEADLPDMAIEPAEDIQPGNREQILLVEDDDNVRDMTTRMLRSLNYRVMTAEDGYAALALIEEGAMVDLLLTDVVLPGGVNGDALAREVIRLKPDAVIVFMSGYPKTAMDRFASIEGETHFLQKPFQKRQLAVRLHELLAGRAGPPAAS